MVTITYRFVVFSLTIVVTPQLLSPPTVKCQLPLSAPIYHRVLATYQQLSLGMPLPPLAIVITIVHHPSSGDSKKFVQEVQVSPNLGSQN
jgi:hypothetical protein